LVGDFRSLPLKIFSGHLGLWSAVASESRARWHQRHWKSKARAWVRSTRVGRSGSFCKGEQMCGASEGVNGG
jgi:hypothetical protein